MVQGDNLLVLDTCQGTDEGEGTEESLREERSLRYRGAEEWA
jgi:hypothetical protein